MSSRYEIFEDSITREQETTLKNHTLPGVFGALLYLLLQENDAVFAMVVWWTRLGSVSGFCVIGLFGLLTHEMTQLKRQCFN